MIPVLKIVSPGFHSTIQDEGRRGYQHVGVPVSGALDRDGFMLANALVGNAKGAALKVRRRYSSHESFFSSKASDIFEQSSDFFALTQ